MKKLIATILLAASACYAEPRLVWQADDGSLVTVTNSGANTNTVNLNLSGATNTPFCWMISYGSASNDTNQLCWTPKAGRDYLITNVGWKAANGGAATGNLFYATNQAASAWDSAVFSNITCSGTVESNKAVAIEGKAGTWLTMMISAASNFYGWVQGVER